MTGIWLLSTMGRPEACQETIDACSAAGMTEPGVVYCDSTDYPDLRLPANWTKHYEPKWRSLQGSLQWAFQNYPDADYYGWLADDNRPRTKHWDTELARAAGRWGLSYGEDNWQSNDSVSRRDLEKGFNMTSGCVWGGDLVRAVGWWALPGVLQGGIDMAWLDIVRPLGLHRWTPGVIIEHWNWRTGKRPRDSGDEWTRPDAGAYVQADLDTKLAWVRAHGAEEAQNRIRKVIPQGII